MSHSNIWEVKNILGLKCFSNLKPKRIKGIFSTGDFDKLWDYDSGILEVCISPTLSDDTSGYVPIVSISTIDDGVWIIRGSVSLSLEDCEIIVEKISAEWEWGTRLPKEKELIDFLEPFGLTEVG